MPGFVDTGLNVVHVDDVAAGHLTAAMRGRTGERYILGGENMSLAAILAEVAAVVGRRPPQLKIPYGIAFPAAVGAELAARITGREPFVTIDGVRMARKKMYFTSAKAARELGYSSRPARASDRRRRQLVRGQRVFAMTVVATETRGERGGSVETPSGKGRGGENFPVGSWLIRRDLRPHVHAFYRFARNADDIADNPALAAADKIRRLDRMAAVLDGGPGDDSPAAAAMRESLIATGTTAQHCHDVLHAFRLDATKLRYRDWDELMEYCRYSASPVGRQLLDLHGERRDAWPASDALCSALQVLNHLQDCAEDYRRLDRVYLPTADLAAAGIDVSALAAPTANPQLRRVFDGLLDRTLAADRKGAGVAGAGRRAGAEAGERGHRRTRRAAGEPSAPWRPAGGAGQTDEIGFSRLFRDQLAQGQGSVSEAALHAEAGPANDIELRDVIRRRVAAAGTSFYWAMRLLPDERRDGMFAVYAFCREVDDIADDDGPAAQKLQALDDWRREIDRLYAGRPRHLVARALREPVLRYDLRQQDFLAVIDGMEMDAAADIRAPDLATLDLYCARVAGAVGHLSVHVFGDASAGRVWRRRIARPGVAVDQYPARP